MPSTPSSQCFDFLGFVALSDNSATGYKSRELQSVSVTPRRGTHLKLRLSGAHVNDFNTNNQIALLAINVLGEDLENTAENAAEAENNAVEPNDALTNNNEELPLASICDDLLFSMYVEESMVAIIRQMEIKKAKAVADERFEYARKLKLCMMALRTAGERLGRYSLAKRQAVQQEDFTTAKLRKEQIEMYRAAVLKQLLVPQLLEEGDEINAANDMASEVYASKPSLPLAPSLQEVAQALTEQQAPTTASSPKSVQEEKSFTDIAGNSSVASNASSHTNSDVLVSPATSQLRKSQDNISCMSPKLNSRRSPSRHSSPMSSRQSSLRRRNKSAPRNSYEDYEERAIPTLRQ